MKKSITKKMLMRMSAQADEADLHGHHGIAAHLTGQIVKYASDVRDNDEDYEYSKEDMIEDMKVHLWDASVRFFDYHDTIPDGRDIESLIDDLCIDFAEQLGNLVPGSKIGKFEPKIPGEDDSLKPPDGSEEIHWEISFKPEGDDEVMVLESGESPDDDEGEPVDEKYVEDSEGDAESADGFAEAEEEDDEEEDDTDDTEEEDEEDDTEEEDEEE